MKLANISIKILLLLSIFSCRSVLAVDQVYTGYFSHKAISGFDAVAFFSEQKPLKGSAKFSLEYKGADWYFSSQHNLEQFKKNPDYFAPQYGGYCAWAMAENKIAPGKPPFWTIYQDKLYLNYDQDIQDLWLADKDNFIKKAAESWAKLDKE
ncbi:MAG: YHS domain-containing protein [Psychromonas sp.]|jgi:YHS domain-containing protein|uniref:YHS domain-containing (seleno)protein n=1 Tax=Psychromonas sp. TaxID=1884585 RepID=UPI0039E36954